MSVHLKKRSTLYEEAKKFLRWRRSNGGLVADLRRDARNHFATVLNRRRALDGSPVEIDVIFRRNERDGRYA